MKPGDVKLKLLHKAHRLFLPGNLTANSCWDRWAAVSHLAAVSGHGRLELEPTEWYSREAEQHLCFLLKTTARVLKTHTHECESLPPYMTSHLLAGRVVPNLSEARKKNKAVKHCIPDKWSNIWVFSASWPHKNRCHDETLVECFIENHRDFWCCVGQRAKQRTSGVGAC